MPRKFPLAKPLHKLKDTALGAVNDPRGAAEKVAGQARGAAAIGKMVAEGVAGEVASRTRRRRGADAPRAASAPVRPAPAAPATEPPGKKQGDPVAPTAAPASAAKKAPAKKGATAGSTSGGAKKVPTPADVAKKAPAKKTAKKAPAKKAAKKAESGPPGDKLPPRKQASAKKAPAKKATPHEPNPEKAD